MTYRYSDRWVGWYDAILFWHTKHLIDKVDGATVFNSERRSNLKSKSPSAVKIFQCVTITAGACLVEGFNTLVTTGRLNLPDKRVDPDCWLRSWFESPRRQLGFKPLSGSHQLRTIHCQATLICASFGGLIIYYHFPFFPTASKTSTPFFRDLIEEITCNRVRISDAKLSIKRIWVLNF